MVLTAAACDALFAEADRQGLLDPVVAALAHTTLACRGPKPLVPLKRRALVPRFMTQKPHTTDELIEALRALELSGLGVLLLHYGERSESLSAALAGRGARVEDLCLYDWALPEDLGPLQGMVRDTLAGGVDAMLFTSQIHFRHLMDVAQAMGCDVELTRALRDDVIVASVGPVCSRALRAGGIVPDVMPHSPNGPSLIQAVADSFDVQPQRGDYVVSVTTDSPRGHLPTLVACFLHFDVCFMLWVLIGALGPFIFDGTQVQAGLKGLLIGMPILTGSLLRVPLGGMLSDRFGGRRVALLLLTFLFAPLLLAWLGPAGIGTLVPASLMLGGAGASFAVVLPLASRWYPAERQGLVMGIAAAGNSGTVLADLFAPRIAAWVGWQNVFGVALIPLGLVLVLFVLLAGRRRPARAPGGQYGRDRRTGRSVVLRVLLCDLRRVSRAQQLPSGLHSRSVQRDTGGGRLDYCGGGLRRQFRTSDRRVSRRSPGWRANAAGAVPGHRGGLPRRRECRHAQRGGVRHSGDDDWARAGQRRGVPDGATALLA